MSLGVSELKGKNGFVDSWMFGWEKHGPGGGVLVVRAFLARATVLRLIPLRGTQPRFGGGLKCVPHRSLLHRFSNSENMQISQQIRNFGHRLIF